MSWGMVVVVVVVGVVECRRIVVVSEFMHHMIMMLEWGNLAEDLVEGEEGEGCGC